MIRNRIGYDFALPQMEDFGNYAVLIHNQKEFIKRVMKAAEKRDYKMVCGDVEYHCLKCGQKSIKSMNSATFITEEAYDSDDMIKDEYVKKTACDTFDKWEQYKSQNEWRITMDCNKTDKSPEILNIGDISDIAKPCKASDIVPTLEKMLARHQIKMVENYEGNISREQMRNRFYEKNEGKVHVSFMMGEAEYD